MSEIPTGFVPQLDKDRLTDIPGGRDTPLGRAAYELLDQFTDINDLHSSLKKDNDRWQDLVQQTAIINPAVVNWWYGLEANIITGYQDYIGDRVIKIEPLVIKLKRLFSLKFGFLTDFAIKNVQEKRPEASDPREEATLIRLESVLVERPGRQVVYGMNCLNLDKSRFIGVLTRTSGEPDHVPGEFYRVDDLNQDEVEKLFIQLAKKDGRRIEPLEVIDQQGKKQTIPLLIIDGEEAFIKGIAEIETAQETIQRVNEFNLPETLPIFSLLNPEIIRLPLTSQPNLWLRAELPFDGKENREIISSFYFSPFLTDRKRLEIEERQAERENVYSWPQEESRESLSLKSEIQRANGEGNHSQIEALPRISRAHKEDVNQPSKIELPLIISSQVSLAPKVQAEINTVPSVEDDLRLTASSFVEEHDFLQATSLPARKEIQLPQADYLPLLAIYQAETSQQEFLNEPQRITIQPEEEVSQEVAPISALKIPLVKEKVIFTPQDQSLTVEQKEDIRPEEKVEITVEPPKVVIKPPSKAVIEIQVSQSPKKKVTLEFLPDDFLIEPEKDSDSQAKKVIEKIDEVKRQTPLIKLPFLPINESPKTHERRLRQSVFNWQILIPKLRLEARKPLMNLSLAEVIRELITVPFPKRRVVNSYEQRENKFSQAILLHSLSRIYVTNSKTNSLPQSQVVFDRRWLPKVIYEAQDPLPGADVIVPIKRKVIKADEYQEVVTIDDLTYEELSLKFLFLPLNN